MLFFSTVQVVTFIQSNGHLLFATNKGHKQDRLVESSPADDYDYVSLESKAKFDQENEEVKRTLPQEMKTTFAVLVAQSEDLPVLPSSNDQVGIYFGLNSKVAAVLTVSNVNRSAIMIGTWWNSTGLRPRPTPFI